MTPCTATTKAGKPCRAKPLAGTKLCLSHTPEDQRGSIRFGGPQPGSGRPANPRAVDVLKERMERDIDVVLAPLFDALGAMRVWTDNQGRVHEAEDYSARIAASRELLDRGYGKPKQTNELSGSIGMTLADLASLTDDS